MTLHYLGSGSKRERFILATTEGRQSVQAKMFLMIISLSTVLLHRKLTAGDCADLWFRASAASVLLRQKVLKKCREDIYHFLDNENGQVAIYDAVNALSSGRKAVAKEFAKRDIMV